MSQISSSQGEGDFPFAGFVGEDVGVEAILGVRP
jgi:hypothetical protein